MGMIQFCGTQKVTNGIACQPIISHRVSYANQATPPITPPPPGPANLPTGHLQLGERFRLLAVGRSLLNPLPA